MPEMSEDNYNALLERLANQDTEIADLKKQIKDIAALNKTLLNSSAPGMPNMAKEQRREQLHDKLFGGK